MGRIEELASEELGYRRLRPGQREAVEALVAGRDVLAVMPTGAGKSAIYQLAGLLLEGSTVVVSPLIALQRDQIEALGELDAAGAELNSTLSESAREERLADFEGKGLEFLILAPEQLANHPSSSRTRRRAGACVPRRPRSSSSTRRAASRVGSRLPA